jgi:predicted nucleotide-binding protein
LKELDRSDYGVFVFAADDITVTDEGEFQSVRDNVLFEFGLFTGRLGKHRNWFMLPRSAKKTIKTASDLFGISPLLYDDVSGETRAVAIGRACHNIRTTLEGAQ